MRSKGSRFTLGVWGLRVCSLDVAFVAATVRNRPQPSVRLLYGCAYGKFCRRCHFWRFQTSRCFVSRGRRGTSWHSEVFCNVSKIVLCARRNTFATFSEDVLQFSWQAQHFGRVHCHFSWQAQHFRRVVLSVFCQSHWQGCVKRRQVANSVADVAFCDMCWKLTEASHETSILRLQNLEVPTKTRRKTSILKLQSVKIGGSLARNARLCSHASRLSLWFSGGVAVSMGEAAKHVLFEGFQAGCHVVLRGRRGTLWHSNLFANVSKMSKLEKVSHEMLVFPAPTRLVSSLWFSCGVAVSMGEAPHSTLYTLQSTIYTLDSTLYTLHSTLYTLHFTLPPPHSRLYTPHFTLHTPHSTLYTLHFTLYTLHSTLDILHSRLYTPHSTLSTFHSTLHTLHSTLLTLHSTLHTSHCTLRTPHSTLSTPHSTLHTLHSTFHTPQFTL